MKFKIIHETKYTFNSKVYLEPHQLRLKPKETPFCSLDFFDLDIFPNPIGLKEQADSENNTIQFIWFSNTASKLVIRSTSIISISEYNPLSFIIYPSQYLNIPFIYTEELKIGLYAYLQKIFINQPLGNYGNNILKMSTDTINFLTNLTQTIHNDFELAYRHEGSPF